MDQSLEPDERPHKTAGVDIDAAEAGLQQIIANIKQTGPPPGALGAVKLDIGYFANVIDIGGIGLAICTDGVGSKSIIAQMMNRYDTIGIDCVAMNVNDAICVGARPISMVDYIAIEKADADILGAIAIGLAVGAKEAGISISAGEIAPPQVRGPRFRPGRDGGRDRAARQNHHRSGSRAGRCHHRARTQRHPQQRLDFGALRLLRARQTGDRPRFPELGIPLGEELLCPTFIYVPEILDIINNIPSLEALINITGDGLLNLPRVDARVGFMIDDLPPVPPVFRLIQQYGAVDDTEMFEVYNMGVGFCVLVSERDAGAALSILHRHGRRAQVIGRVVEDDGKGVHLPRERLVGHGKAFTPI